WPLDEQTSALRGRIRMAEQVSRHHGRLYPLEVSHEEHGVDIPENRILRAATGELLRTARAGSATPIGVGLRRIYRTLAEAGPLRAGDLSAWRPTRLNSRYHRVLKLCELVLSERGVEARAGRIETRGFLINTPQVFEAAFARALGEQSDSLLAGCRVETQRSLPYVEELPDYRLRPDIVLTRGGAPVAVLDTKYKRAGSGPSREDMYQMVTYALCHGLQDVHLVYAEPLPAGSADVLHVAEAGIRVHLHGVDLGQGPDGFLTQTTAVTRQLLQPKGAPSVRSSITTDEVALHNQDTKCEQRYNGSDLTHRRPNGNQRPKNDSARSNSKGTARNPAISERIRLGNTEHNRLLE
ncbi:McrC family protein, partial [Dermabacteraceae bacterium P13101]